MTATVAKLPARPREDDAPASGSRLMSVLPVIPTATLGYQERTHLAQVRQPELGMPKKAGTLRTPWQSSRPSKGPR
jgi:hypothetical protein